MTDEMTGEATRRLDPERLQEIREAVEVFGVAPTDSAYRPPWETVHLLLGHIDAIESELASCRAGQPRHKDQA